MGVLSSQLVPLDLPSGAVIIWVESDTCPSGYSKITEYGYYIGADSSYSVNAGASHDHAGVSHEHSIASGSTEANKISDNPYADFDSTGMCLGLTDSGKHTASAGTSSTESGSLSQAPAGLDLEHVKVVLCKKN